MTRSPTSSRSSRFRSANSRPRSTRSASTHSAGGAGSGSSSPSLNLADWPSPLLRSYPHPQGGNISSSDGEHSPSHVNETVHDQPVGETSVVNGNEVQGDDMEMLIEEDDEDEEGDHRLPIKFDALGQPVKEGSKQYSTKVGNIVRSEISPAFDDWRNVPWEQKELAWKSLKNFYRVPEFIKDKFLKMCNSSWKNRKRDLRKVCDKYPTVAERKNNNPGDVKKEHWEAFVDMHNTDKDKKLRVIGKTSRKQLKALHSTGRDGIARRRDVMEEQSPTGSVTRSEVYLATHVYQEIPEDQLNQLDPNDYEFTCRKYVGMIRELYETEQYREETHLDRDAVAQVFGPDGRGYVRGIGGGISKTEIFASAVPREQLRKEKLKNRKLDGRVCTLEKTVGELKSVLSSNPATTIAQSQPATTIAQSQPATTIAQSQGMNGSAPTLQAYVLRNFIMKPVAFGHLHRTEVSANPDFKLVVIDEIVLPSERLCDDERTFEDVYLGESIMWPANSVCQWLIPMA